MVQVDKDGDLIVARRSDRETKEDTVLSEMHLETIKDKFQDGYFCTTYPILGSNPIICYHRMATPLDAVGCQIWRGAALLADYLFNLKDLRDSRTIVELGAGPGLVSLAAARAGAPCIFATDILHQGILTNCLRNVQINTAIDRIRVRELDWMHSPAWLIPQLNL